MTTQDPYAVLKMVFAARFGPEFLALNQASQPKPAAAGQPREPVGGSGTSQDSSGGAEAPQGQGFDPGALEALLAQSEDARKIMLTDQLTQAAMTPPVSEQEMAVFLNAAMQSNPGEDGDALALG